MAFSQRVLLVRFRTETTSQVTAPIVYVCSRFCRKSVAYRDRAKIRKVIFVAKLKFAGSRRY